MHNATLADAKTYDLYTVAMRYTKTASWHGNEQRRYKVKTAYHHCHNDNVIYHLTKYDLYTIVHQTSM